MESLTEQVLYYQRTGEGLSRLLYRVSCQVYVYPSQRPGFEEDDCGEFFLYARRRIPSLIHNFCFTGKPFEVYMNSCLRWQLRSFAAHKTKMRRRYRVCNAPERWEELNEAELKAAENPEALFAHRPDISAGGSPLHMPDQKRHRRTCSGRRLVILALKGCLRLQEEDMETLAHETGFQAEQLASAWRTLRHMSERRLQRLHRLRTMRNRSFFRLLCLQDELADAVEVDVKSKLTADLIRHKRRLDTIRARIAHVPLAPTNKEIAEVLSIPKGSVDSTLYYMRNLWKKGAFSRSDNGDFGGAADIHGSSQRYA